MQKLKCCPFCGHEGTLRSMRFGMEKANRYAVTCTVCQIAIGWEDSEEKAIERWNRRVEDSLPQPDKEVECVMCGETFTEDDLVELREMGEQYHREKSCFLCPDCWDSFRRMDPEEQVKMALVNGWKEAVHEEKTR